MRKIGELKGKPIIEGNPNEIKRNQLHYKESDGNITLSERKEDNTLSSVTSGSGGGEGVKEYYYKVITQDPNIVFFMTQVGVIYFIVEVKGEIKETLSSKQFSNHTYAFKLLDIPYSFVGTDEGNIVNVYDGFNGDIYDRYLKFGELNGATDITREDTIVELSQYIQEITKEEYEAMITYKPE